MSLILDALRKSEAERRRGDLPALSLELPPAPARTTPARAWWLAVPVGVALAALVIWHLQRNAPDLPEPAAAGVPVVASDDPAAPRPLAAPPDAAAVADAPPEADPLPAPAVPRAPVPRVAQPPPAGATPAASGAPGPPGTPAARDAAVAEASGTLPAALADLPVAERQALPPLKLSMHMWSPDPARRFVILDGHRLSEGDRAGTAVVERIDPDGVVLVADGRRIRLPLR